MHDLYLYCPKNGGGKKKKKVFSTFCFTGMVSDCQKWSTSPTPRFSLQCTQAGCFRPAKKGESPPSATATSDLCWGEDQDQDQEALIPRSCWDAADWESRSAFTSILPISLLQLFPGGETQPGWWRYAQGPDTDHHSPDTFFGYQRPHPS